MLSIIYLIFFLATFPYAMMRSRLFGIYYAALYIYSAFSIAGYLYLPGVSESIAAYFGDDIGHQATLFVLASMAAFWALNMVIYRPRIVETVLLHASHTSRVPVFGQAIFGLLTVSFAGLLALNFADLSWYLFEQSDALPLQTSIFLALYKTVVGVLISGYVLLRSEDIVAGRVFTMLYAVLFLVFAVASIQLGNRTDPSAFLVGVIFYEATQRKLTLKTVARLGILTLVAVSGLFAIEYFRYTDYAASGPLIERVVANDYYAPAHMLFAAMAFNFVDPIAVIDSNSANALILMNVPYLQQTITELFRTGVATRSAGYAFYILAEGWIFAGWTGILYNAIVPSAGLWLWSRSGRTDSRLLNTIALSLVASMLLNVTRGQSSYFIKYLYMYILPNLVFAMILIGVRLRLPMTSKSMHTAGV